jgi:mercuric reductase
MDWKALTGKGFDVRMSVTDGLERLRQILPLEARQAKLPENHRILHKAILGGFAGSGRPLGTFACGVVLGGEDVRQALADLAQADLVVLSKHGAIQGAYPFTTAKTPHRVTLNGHTVHAMCALDAVAVAPMFGVDTVAESVCEVDGTRLRIEQRGSDLLAVLPRPEVHVGIQWGTTDGAAARSI